MGELPIVELRDSSLLTEMEHKKLLHNTGIAHLVKHTLPPAKQGLKFTFGNLAANQTMNVYAQPTNFIADAAAKSAKGGRIMSVAGAIAGLVVSLVCITPGQWSVVEKAGTWTTH